ncbi:MAG: cysteine desulfurase [Thermodesulfovibrionales bacterium]|nr:cysteine desulfurase [Thermodesulfovibrionales bacterium]
MDRPIYLDYNATTPLDEEVKQSIIESLDVFGNPSSIHYYGQQAKELIEKSRQSVAQLLCCKSDEIIFTSGGTEANNLAIFGVAYSKGSGHIITSSIEHPAVMMPIKKLSDNGFVVTYLPVDSKGIIDPDDVKKAIRHNTILVSIMHANNETGMIQPIKEIGNITKPRGIVFHSDGAQSVGKVETDMDLLGVDLFSLAGHKLYAPKGVGALFIREGLNINPFCLGAGHERGLRPGTENIIGISGLGKACEVAKRDFQTLYDHNLSMTNFIYNSLLSNLPIRINGMMDNKLPNTLNVSILGISANDLIIKLKDMVALSSGSACHAGVCKPSYVLKAMGLTDEEALSAIRFSTGKFTNLFMVEKALESIYNLIQISYKKK